MEIFMGFFNYIPIVALTILTSAIWTAKAAVLPTLNSPFSIIPDQFLNDNYSNDPLLVYQWGLFNRKQITQYDIDDIHYEQIVGDEKIDIGIKNIYASLAGKTKKNIIIAILDGGVDIAHPDIKNNILKNEIECENGKLPFEPIEDKDNNGYIGDCMGWNFTGKKESGDNLIYDDDGHGTHLAGIIAAESNNKIGIAGIAQNIKILPIKVLYKKDKNNKAISSLSVRLAKGILYAIKMKADIINLSLGWPKSLETKELNESIQLALSSGVVVVAAAGNNNSSEPVYPCAVEGVICVGSISNDGSISRFSNYGGSVDLLAPGDNILSTYPEKLNPVAFSIEGYEIKSGTSQAAPFISAMMGLLKSIFTNETNSEILSRLDLSTNPIMQDKKFTLAGLPNLEKALNLAPAPMVKPVFKTVQYISYTKINNKFSFELPIKNYWLEDSEVSVEVKLNSNHLIIDNSLFKIINLKQDAVTKLKITGQISDTTISNKVMIEVTVSSKKSGTKKYYNNLTITRILDLEQDKSLISYRLPIDAKKIEMISTLTNKYSKTTAPEYYLEEYTSNALLLSLFRLENDQYGKVANTISLSNAKKLISILKMDINYDGKDDYFIGALVKTEKEQFIQYSFYDNNLSPLFPSEYSQWKFIPETVYLDLKTLWFIPFQSKTLGKIAIPCFLANGRVPLLDKNPDSFSVDSRENIPHIYYLIPVSEPTGIVLKTRIFDNYKLIKWVTNKLQLSWNEDFILHYVLPQSGHNFKEGILKAVFSVEKDLSQSYYLASVNTQEKYQFVKIENQGVEMANNYLYPTINLSENDQTLTDFSALIGFQRDNLATHVLIDSNNNSLSSFFKQTTSSKRDHFVSFMASYKKDDTSYSFWQSRDELIYHSINSSGKEYNFSIPINRFSFLPGNIFQELYTPITANIANDLRPALYIDSTQINSKHIYLTTIDENQNLISPAEFNVEIPTQCNAKNPIRWGEKKNYAYALFCKQNEQINLVLLPLEL